MKAGFAYDVVDYPAHVYPQLHPSRLAAIARLHGVRTASPKACRLLEVGCGEGLQLLALAQAYPGSAFVGVDLSANAIARGEAIRKQLGLDNLQLVAADLLEWEPGPEPFDCIVAHGFWSWVPDPVREGLLALCARTLAPAGIACISYNTLPGCHLRRMLWEILRFHSEGAATPDARVARAIECLDLLELGMPAGKRYTTTMAGEIRELRDRLDPNVLFHDDLAPLNDPCTFDEFLRRARGHGLEFVAEASYHEMSLRNAGEDARPMLEEIARDDVATKEQYLDFMTGRRFRQTLLCRAQARPRPRPDPDALAEFEVVSALAADPAGPDASGRLRFSHPASGSLTTGDAAFQQALVLCAKLHPQPQAIAGLAERAQRCAGSAGDAEAEDGPIRGSLLHAFEVGILELHCDAPAFAAEPSERPVASPLARLLAAAGRPQVPNLRPRMIELPDPLSRTLLAQLDGTRDRAALRQSMADEPGGHAVDRLDDALQEFARMALLR